MIGTMDKNHLIQVQTFPRWHWDHDWSHSNFNEETFFCFTKWNTCTSLFENIRIFFYWISFFWYFIICSQLPGVLSILNIFCRSLFILVNDIKLVIAGGQLGLKKLIHNDSTFYIYHHQHSPPLVTFLAENGKGGTFPDFVYE